MNIKNPFQILAWCFLILCAGPGTLQAGPLTRVANTTLAMPSAPPTFGYTHANAFSGLTFFDPIAIVSPPGETNRLFIVEKNGRIQVISNLASPSKTVFLDIQSQVIFTDSNSGGTGEQGLLGLAFHPGYATNRFFYVWYTGNATTTAGTGRHDILARFQTSSTNPNSAPASSQQRMIVQFDQQPNHNSGHLTFGPDGYLYVTVADEGGGDDSQANSQRIDKDFFSGVLRIDVDNKAGNLTPNSHASVVAGTYRVPSDNPFIGATSFNGSSVNPANVRTELWAVGLRNPWGQDFDPATGIHYLADVGQAQREEVDIIQKGKNYGWKHFEGTVQRSTPPPAMVHTPPIHNYSHSGGRVCIIGGVVYRGTRLSQLSGAYVFAEYATGEIFFLRYNGTSVTANGTLFTDTSGFPTGFGRDPRNGDVLYCRSGTSGTASSAQIHKINYNSTTNGAPIPAQLSGTGAFSSLTSLTPNAGIVAYELNVPFWSDNAIKSRWFSVPNTSLDMTFNATANWTFPTGSVWVKHFELELTNGVPSSRKRLETRFIVKNSGGVYGVTYRWGTSTSNANLVPEEGMDDTFVIRDSGGGIIRTQVWHYPSRVECLACHTGPGGFALGFNTPQLNRDHNYSGTDFNQIQALSEAGYFTATAPEPATLQALAPASDTSATLEHRAKSYVAANCVQCHQPGGPAILSLWDARFNTPLTSQGIINGALNDNLGNSANRVIVPQALANSVLHQRIAVRGGIQMPPLASSVVDDSNVSLIEDWINGMDERFWVSATPFSRTITAGGASTTFTISSLDAAPFTGTVNLGVSGMPAGMTATFSPTSVNPPVGSTLTVTADSSTVGGVYPLTISGTSGTSQTEPQTVVVKVNGASNPLPAPWVGQDIGAVGVAGSSSFSSGTFTIDASGADIWSTADEFHYVHQAVNGDITITARVATQEKPHAWSKSGVMIRETTAAGSAHAAVYVSASNGVSMQIRPSTGASSINLITVAGFAAPHWVRLVRSGNTFTGFRSADGNTWTQVSSTNITMAASARAGMAVSSHNDAVLATTTFDNVSVSSPAPDFSMSATPGSRTVTAGDATTYTATVTAVNGFNSVVDFSSSGAPAATTVTFNPTSVTGSGSSTVTVDTSPSTPDGTHLITLTGTSGSLVRNVMVSLVVNPVPVSPTNFTLSVTPSSQAINAGGADVNYTVNSTSTNFSSPVTLSLSGLPSGASASFSPNPITPPQSSTMTVSAASNTAAGSFPITVSGTGGGLTRTAGTTLVVNNSQTPQNILQEAEWLARVSSGPPINVVADALASNGQWVSLLSSNVGQFIDYTVTNIPAGTYDVSLIYKRHQNRGIHSLLVDGVQVGGTLNQYGSSVAFLEQTFGSVTFAATTDHTVRLQVTGKDPAAGNHNLSADAFRFVSGTPDVWQSQDIGAVGIAGSFSQNGNQFTIAGSGSDIWSTADQFRFAYQSMSGNFEVIARVVSEQQTHAFAKAGVMIRESLATNSANASVLLTPTNGVALQIRPSTGATSINVTGWVKGPVPPRWVRLVRSGNTFTGFHSTDGSTWTTLGSTNVTMNTSVTAGMAVTSHNNAALNTAVFE